MNRQFNATLAKNRARSYQMVICFSRTEKHGILNYMLLNIEFYYRNIAQVLCIIYQKKISSIYKKYIMYYIRASNLIKMMFKNQHRFLINQHCILILQQNLISYICIRTTHLYILFAHCSNIKYEKRVLFKYVLIFLLADEFSCAVSSGVFGPNHMKLDGIDELIRIVKLGKNVFNLDMLQNEVMVM